MGVENLNVLQGDSGEEPKHALREETVVPSGPVDAGAGEPVDPATQFTPPEETPEPHDDVDVALQDGKDVADGPGDEEPGESDFQSYAEADADKQEDNS